MNPFSGSMVYGTHAKHQFLIFLYLMTNSFCSNANDGDVETNT